MKVLIQGAGIAGLALANALKQKGITPTIIEKYPNNIPDGYWIYIWDNGRRVLRKLGLENQLDKHAFQISGSDFVDKRGKRLQFMDLTKYHPDFALLACLERPQINKILRKPIKNIPIINNMTTKSIIQSKDGVRVELSDGTKDIYDLVVGADGFNSDIRTKIFPEIEKQYYGMHLWLFKVKFGDIKIPTDIYTSMGKGVFVTVLPNGGKFCLVYLLITVPKGKYSKNNVGMELVRSKLKGFAEPFNSLMPLLSEETLVYQADLQKIESDQWVKDRVVIIGDAQHTMSQVIGQGASLALEDAYVLANELTKFKNRSVKKSLLAFQNKRQKRVEFMQVYSNKIMFLVKQKRLVAVILRSLFMRRIISPDFILDNLQERIKIKVVDD